MISMLHGIVYEKNPGVVVVECGGVGYDVVVPIGSYNAIASVGGECRLFVRHVVREDDEQLYGFATREERSVFNLLQGVSGVGPKLALAVIDGLSVTDFRRCVVNGDARRLGTVKGVGKKTAERIIVELKGKINPVEAMSNDASGPVDAGMRDAILALGQLGFGGDVACKMAQAAIDAGADRGNTEEIIRKALASR